MSRQVLAWALLAALLGCIPARISATPEPSTVPPRPSPAAPSAAAPCAPTSSGSFVSVAGRRVAVDVAATEASRATGLSGRPCLARGTGLVLAWDAPTVARIWMPRMNFPIDVVFVRADRVVAVFADAQPCIPGEDCPSFGPNDLVDYVLEVPAGTAAEWGLRAGDAITLTR